MRTPPAGARGCGLVDRGAAEASCRLPSGSGRPSAWQSASKRSQPCGAIVVGARAWRRPEGACPLARQTAQHRDAPPYRQLLCLSASQGGAPNRQWVAHFGGECAPGERAASGAAGAGGHVQLGLLGRCALASHLLGCSQVRMGVRKELGSCPRGTPASGRRLGDAERTAGVSEMLASSDRVTSREGWRKIPPAASGGCSLQTCGPGRTSENLQTDTVCSLRGWQGRSKGCGRCNVRSPTQVAAPPVCPLHIGERGDRGSFAHLVRCLGQQGLRGEPWCSQLAAARSDQLESLQATAGVGRTPSPWWQEAPLPPAHSPCSSTASTQVA